MNLTSFDTDKAFEEKLKLQATQDPGLCLFFGKRPEISSIDDDLQRATDLRAGGLRIACRFRREQYKNYFEADFTIRYIRPHALTEADKISHDCPDYFLYGLSKSYRPGMFWLESWRLLNYPSVLFCIVNKEVGYQEKNNLDGSSAFIAVRWKNLPSNIVVAIRDGGQLWFDERHYR